MSKAYLKPKLLIAGGLLVIVLLGLAAVDPGGPDVPYATAYSNALPRYPGHAPVSAEALDQFLQHFTHLQALSDEDGQRLYAANVYFSDTLLTTEDRAQLVRHINGLRENDARVRLAVVDTLIKDADVYLIWSMDATFTPIHSSVTSNSIGVTHLRFNRAGQVVLQQDFWDSAEGFYKQVPVVGRVIRSIGRSFQNSG